MSSSKTSFTGSGVVTQLDTGKFVLRRCVDQELSLVLVPTDLDIRAALADLTDAVLSRLVFLRFMSAAQFDTWWRALAAACASADASPAQAIPIPSRAAAGDALAVCAPPSPSVPPHGGGGDDGPFPAHEGLQGGVVVMSRLCELLAPPSPAELRLDRRARAQWASIQKSGRVPSFFPTPSSAMRSLLRFGLPTGVRRVVVPRLVSIPTPVAAVEWDALLSQTFGGYVAAYGVAPTAYAPDPALTPSFGGKVDEAQRALCFSDAGRLLMRKVLCCLSSRHPSVRHAPMLAPLCAALLTHLPPAEVVFCASRFVDAGAVDAEAAAAVGAQQVVGGRAVALLWLLPVSHPAAALQRLVARRCVYERCRDTAMALQARGVDLGAAVGEWLESLFLGVLPVAAALRAVDAYVVGGRVALLRVAVAVCAALLPAARACADHAAAAALLSPSGLAAALPRALHVVRAGADAALTAAEVTAWGDACVLEAAATPSPPQVPPHLGGGCYLRLPVTYHSSTGGRSASYPPTAPPIVPRPQDWEFICACVPPQHRFGEWQRIFSTSVDGYALSSLYRCVVAPEDAPIRPHLLVVRCSPAAPGGGGGGGAGVWVLAAYFPTGIQRSDVPPPPHYYGTPNAFICQVAPSRSFHTPAGTPPGVDPARDQLPLGFGDLSALCMGGAGPDAAVCVRANLQTGSSARTALFLNPVLCAEEYTVSGVEVYGLAKV